MLVSVHNVARKISYELTFAYVWVFTTSIAFKTVSTQAMYNFKILEQVK